MKLYTRTGDDGTTGLFGGDRVSKDDLRIEAYGAVDELNAQMGMILVVCEVPLLKEHLSPLQSRLFDLGADLATPCGSEHEDKISRMAEENVTNLERSIDAIEGRNEPIKTFVMPGGTELASRIHVARCTCRRAERAIVRLAHRDTVNIHTIEFVNRLSDLLFAASRLANREAGGPDVPWIPHKP